MSDGRLTIDDLMSASEAIKRLPATPPMRWVCIDEAKRLILNGRADQVLVSVTVLEQLKADPELAALAYGERR